MMRRRTTESIAIAGLCGLAATIAACATQQVRSTAVPNGLSSKATAVQPLAVPTLPAVLYAYSDASAPLPRHYQAGGRGGGRGGRGGGGGRGGPGGSVIGTDHTPANNPTTDAGATLGRVLFYDVRLSANDKISCGSCHIQEFGFSDTARLSVGLNGERTARHAMSLANARFYRTGSYFWDERAPSLEAQVLQPIQNDVEMGMQLELLIPKLKSTGYYPALFTSAFGSAEVTRERVAMALAQFVRSMVSGASRFDAAFNAGRGQPNFAVLTPLEQEGQRLFAGRAGCQPCHGTNAQLLDEARNNGLDAPFIDAGVGGGRFKAPSLRNVAVRPPYMHDGRFKTLREVIDFYDHGVKGSPDLDRRLRGPGGRPQRLNLSEGDKNALVAFLESLTDNAFLMDLKFSNPFGAFR